MPKLPTIHQLANHSSTACQKWQEGKKSVHQTWTFLHSNKKIPGVKFTSAQLNKFARIVISLRALWISLRALWISLHALWINFRALWINFCISQYVSAHRSKVFALTKMFPHPQVIFRGASIKLKCIKNNSTLNIYIYMWNFYPNGQLYGWGIRHRFCPIFIHTLDQA